MPNNLRYSRLMVPTFPDLLVGQLKKWGREKGFPKEHPLWHRLQGTHKHCLKQFLADGQVRVEEKEYAPNDPVRRAQFLKKKDHRYTMVNYCWALHRTVEVRVLPMFNDASDAVEALQIVIDTVNLFLSTGPREDRERVLVPPARRFEVRADVYV